jgi:hypothetical protein
MKIELVLLATVMAARVAAAAESLTVAPRPRQA